jgi:hypothetical protein
VVPSDWALMVLMKRMATGNRYRDVAAVVGGNKTELCVTFLHMLELLHDKYKDRLRNLKFFTPFTNTTLAFPTTVCVETEGAGPAYGDSSGTQVTLKRGLTSVTLSATGTECHRGPLCAQRQDTRCIPQPAVVRVRPGKVQPS